MLAIAIALALIAWAIYTDPRRRAASSEEAIGLAVTAVKDKGGVKLPADRFSWASDDEAVAQLVPTFTDSQGAVVDPGPYGRVLVTPNPGACNVIVTNTASGNTETMPVEIGFSEDGEIGLSAG